MNYIKEDGTNKHLIITLHGTGGNARDLFGIAKMLDNQATKVGFEGNVMEHGMRRFFARYPYGGFDLDSLKKGSDDLYRSIQDLIKRYKFQDYTITLMGYSNGANIAKDLLKEYKLLEVSNVLLFHPSPITPDKAFKKQEGLAVFMTSGKEDPYINAFQFQDIKEKMEKASIEVTAFTQDLGHQLIEEEINQAKVFLQGKME